MTGKPRYVLTLEAGRDPLNRSPEIRLRLALKLLLRACGLRAISIRESTGATGDGRAGSPTAPGAADPARAPSSSSGGRDG